MNPDTLARAGRLLLGDEWQRPLARVLGPLHPDGAREAIDDRLVRRWLAGDRPIPEWVDDVLAELLEAEATAYQRGALECRELAEELRFAPRLAPRMG